MATKEKTAEEKVEKKALTPEDGNAYWDELVPFEAFKDRGKYSADIVVGVNGRVWQIQRGEKVMIPRKVAEVLRISQEQDTATARMIEDKASKYRMDAAALN